MAFSIAMFNSLKTSGKKWKVWNIFSSNAFKWQLGNSIISRLDSRFMKSSPLSISRHMLFQNHYCSICFSQSWLAKVWAMKPFQLCMLKSVPFSFVNKRHKSEYLCIIWFLQNSSLQVQDCNWQVTFFHFFQSFLKSTWPVFEGVFCMKIISLEKRVKGPMMKYCSKE